MRIETRDFLCGICGASVSEWIRVQTALDADFVWDFENELDEGATDTEHPPGWIQILVRRVIPNPALRNIDDVLSEMMVNVPEAEKAAARGVLKQQAEAVVALDSEPECVLDEVEMTVCSTCAYTSDAVARLASIEPEAFTAAKWFVVSNIAPVEPEKEETEEGQTDGKAGAEESDSTAPVADGTADVAGSAHAGT